MKIFVKIQISNWYYYILVLKLLIKGVFMINFNEEILKFKPIVEIDDIEDSLTNDEIYDIIDIIKEITKDRDRG